MSGVTEAAGPEPSPAATTRSARPAKLSTHPSRDPSGDQRGSATVRDRPTARAEIVGSTPGQATGPGPEPRGNRDLGFRLHAELPSPPQSRLVDLSGEPALRRSGGLHPVPRPRDHRARPPHRSALRPALARARRPVPAGEDPQPRPLPAGQPVPGAVAVGVPGPDRPPGVRDHVRGRLPGAVHVQPPRPEPAREPPPRLRSHPRQPVPRHRPARDDGRRLAGRGDAPPPDHGGPRPRHGARRHLRGSARRCGAGTRSSRCR